MINLSISLALLMDQGDHFGAIVSLVSEIFKLELLEIQWPNLLQLSPPVPTFRTLVTLPIKIKQENYWPERCDQWNVMLALL